MKDVDTEVLAAVFASRVQFAKKTEEEVVAEALKEWTSNLAWLQSAAHSEGSFLWYCDEFDLDPGAVRRAVKERRK